tara:strand:+ start:1152 stop:1832 length:681 start_codon:yes stop_codon:yes gene_type:complete
MNNKLKNKFLFIDFDSTFIKTETLDELAKIALKDDPNKIKKIDLIAELTNKAMCGEISFSEALINRLNILNITSKHIQLVTQVVSNQISNSVKRNKDFFKLHSDNIWIISGGFKQVIYPCVASYGIKIEHILANDLIISSEKVNGINIKNPMSQDKGKIKVINSLNVGSESYMIGDGYTDYEVYIEKASSHFIYFSENILRDKVASKAKLHAKSFEEVMKIIYQKS